jgi:hypothetical protein
MSFLRHVRSIGPMCVLTSRKAQPGCRLPLVGTVNRNKGATEIAPLLIVRDESHRLSLGGLLSSVGLQEVETGKEPRARMGRRSRW